MTPTANPKWHPLELFAQRFAENLAALENRDPRLAARLRSVRPAQPLYVSAEGDQIFLGRAGAAGIESFGPGVSPATARKMLFSVFPKDEVGWPILIAGLSYGWLWDRASKLTCNVDVAPRHRPPIYLLAADVERLWAVMHLMDWRGLLADPRLPLFVGPDAVAQLQAALIADPGLKRPKVCLGVEPALWNAGTAGFDALMQSVNGATDRELSEIVALNDAAYSVISTGELAAGFRSGKLRVLGITSRYTTFLQYSMRDWLAAFERLGHETRLQIEPADHLIYGGHHVARAVQEFRPDLVVVIDHYRAVIGRVPASIPCVMWVQDRMPHIFDAKAGSTQGRRDYCLGFGRLHLAEKFGYPIDRFMSSTVGINEEKYARIELPAAALQKYACDVAYVSHASQTGRSLVEAEVARNEHPSAGKLLWNMHDRMVAHFEGGGSAMSDPLLQRKLTESMQETGIHLTGGSLQFLMTFFNQRVNNALFRHQALIWLAEAGVDLRLYGNGWEKHPQLSRFARGPADNTHELPLIYRASKINLQLIPHGAVHQRMLDGLAAGAFFLVRHTPGDAAGVPYLKLWDWCRRNGISSDAEMRGRADTTALRCIDEIDALLGYATATHTPSLFNLLQATADSDFMTLASAVWPAEYPQVAFSGAAELREKVTRFLGNEAERRRIAGAMRDVVVERCSYVNINRRLLRLIADDLSRGAQETSPGAATLAA